MIQYYINNDVFIMVELKTKVIFNAGSFKIIIPKAIVDSLKLKEKGLHIKIIGIRRIKVSKLEKEK